MEVLENNNDQSEDNDSDFNQYGQLDDVAHESEHSRHDMIDIHVSEPSNPNDYAQLVSPTVEEISQHLMENIQAAKVNDHQESRHKRQAS